MGFAHELSVIGCIGVACAIYICIKFEVGSAYVYINIFNSYQCEICATDFIFSHHVLICDLLWFFSDFDEIGLYWFSKLLMII